MAIADFDFQILRATSTAWTSNNPTLLEGQFGYETDTRKLKIGDGATAWSSLSYLVTYPGAPGIDDVLAEGQSLTASRTVTLNSQTLAIAGSSNTTTFRSDGFLQYTNQVRFYDASGGSWRLGTGFSFLGSSGQRLQFVPSDSVNPSRIYFFESSSNGSNIIDVRGPASIASNKTQTFQDRDGTIAITDLENFTTTERDALTPNTGRQIFNTTTGTVDTYNGTSWISALAGTGIELLTGTGTPEGAETADIGTLYINDANGDVYTKQEDTTSTGWSKLAIESNLGTITTETISVTQNDWLPNTIDRGIALVNVTSNSDITGIVAQTAGYALKVVNEGTGTLTFKKQNTNSIAANRIVGQVDVQVKQGEFINLIYSTTIPGWCIPKAG